MNNRDNRQFGDSSNTKRFPFGHPSSLHRELNNSGKNHHTNEHFRVEHVTEYDDEYGDDETENQDLNQDTEIGHYHTGDHHIRPFDGHILYGQKVSFGPEDDERLSDEEVEHSFPHEHYRKLAHEASIFLGFRKPFERKYPAR